MTIQPNYNDTQINYVHELHEQAKLKGDIPKEMMVSSFMLGYYFKLGYDRRFQMYWDGVMHKPHWRGLNVRVDELGKANGKALEVKVATVDVHRFP